MSAQTPSRPRPRWVLLEIHRSLVATFVALVLAVPVLLCSPMLIDAVPVRTLFAVVLIWGLFSATHTVTTWWAFHGLAGDQLRTALTEETRRRRRERWTQRLNRALLGSSSAASWSVQLSVMALLGVLVLVLIPELRTYTWVLVAVLLMAGASWANVALTYAVNYARLDAEAGAAQPQLGFSGEGPRSFSDYLYFALGVQTTFATTDVEVRTTDMRRVVTVQSLLAFAFNTVIIAILVSLMVSAA